MAALSLTGCATTDPSPASHPAVVSLLTLAAAQRDAGQLEAAVATVERALRIEERNPSLWNRLAALRLEQGDAAQAESLARKALSLAAADPAIRAESWRLIAAARGARGDAAGAEAAQDEARRLEGR